MRTRKYEYDDVFKIFFKYDKICHDIFCRNYALQHCQNVLWRIITN